MSRTVVCHVRRAANKPNMSYARAMRRRGPSRPPLQGVVVPDEGHTAKKDGAMRNNFVVDILKLNGKEFKGTISHLDAIKLIFVAALGFNPQEFAVAVPGYQGNPTVLFKTKEVFNSDEKFAGKSTFSFIKRIRKEDGETHCEIRGVRLQENGETLARSSNTWVKVEGADYQVKPQTIRRWLLEFGTLMSDITEDKADLELSSEEEELYQGVELTIGIHSVKMRLFIQIPQFLPIDGKKIWIYYKGIPKLCTKCFTHGHLRQACDNDQDDWMTYLDRFMINSELEDELFGKWVGRIADWRLSNADLHQRNMANYEADWEREKERRLKQQDEAEKIIKSFSTLEVQALATGTEQASLADTVSGHPTENSDQPSPHNSGSESSSDTATVCDTDEEIAHTREEQSATNQKPNYKRLHDFNLGEAPKAKTASRVSSGRITQTLDERNTDKRNEFSVGKERDMKKMMTAPDKKIIQMTRKTRSTSVPRNETNATKN